MRKWRIQGQGKNGPFTLVVSAVDYTEANRIVCRKRGIVHIESIVLMEGE